MRRYGMYFYNPIIILSGSGKICQVQIPMREKLDLQTAAKRKGLHQEASLQVIEAQIPAKDLFQKKFPEIII